MSVYKHETTRRAESTQFPGVSIILKKMTEKRRQDLRKLLGAHNARVRQIIREQAELEKQDDATRDMAKWLDLQDEFDGLMLDKINPVWITWGVKQIEGLEADGKPLSVDDWEEWPSALVNEVVEAVKAESELNGTERKNSELPTTSGEVAGQTHKLSIVPSAGGRDSGAIETADLISQNT